MGMGISWKSHGRGLESALVNLGRGLGFGMFFESYRLMLLRGFAIDRFGGWFIPGICWNIRKMADTFLINILINALLALCVRGEKKH